jgi:hypothetical protein
MALDGRAAGLWRFEMWKIVAILMLTLSVMLLARLVYKAPTLQLRLGENAITRIADADAPRIPVLIHAGIRG